MEKTYKNNTTGVRGVSFETRSQKYRAYISYNKKRFYLGYFTDLDAAIYARNQAEDFYRFDKDKYSGYALINYVLSKFKFINDEERDFWYNISVGLVLYDMRYYTGEVAYITYAINKLYDLISVLTIYEEPKEHDIVKLATQYADKFNSQTKAHPEETKYITLYLRGYSPKQIADELKICTNTTYKKLKESLEVIMNYD